MTLLLTVVIIVPLLYAIGVFWAGLARRLVCWSLSRLGRGRSLPANRLPERPVFRQSHELEVMPD